jgi:hypothetical protein
MVMLALVACAGRRAAHRDISHARLDVRAGPMMLRIVYYASRHYCSPVHPISTAPSATAFLVDLCLRVLLYLRAVCIACPTNQ